MLFNMTEMTAPVFLGFFQQIGPFGLIIILVIALIIFGKRLPDVARNLGKGIVEFKKGVKGIEDDVDDSSSKPSVTTRPEDDRHEPTSGQPATDAVHGEDRTG